MRYVLKYFNLLSNLGQKFNCPEPNGTFEDFKQCDKYYECYDNIAEERLCPDGLGATILLFLFNWSLFAVYVNLYQITFFIVFDPFSRKREPCDHYFNVDCGDRLELRELNDHWKEDNKD